MCPVSTLGLVRQYVAFIPLFVMTLWVVTVWCYESWSKVRPRTCFGCPEEEQTYSSTLSLASALDGGGWSTPRIGRFSPCKQTRYPLYRRLGGSQAPSGRVRKISPSPGFDIRTVQTVASRCTDWAIPALMVCCFKRTKALVTRGTLLMSLVSVALESFVNYRRESRSFLNFEITLQTLTC